MSVTRVTEQKAVNSQTVLTRENNLRYVEVEKSSIQRLKEFVRTGTNPQIGLFQSFVDALETSRLLRVLTSILTLFLNGVEKASSCG